MMPLMTESGPTRGAYLLEGTLLATLVLGPGIAVAVGMDSEHGSIADWVAALATVAAFIAAVLAGRTAVALWRIESGRDEERRTQDKQQQAVQIAAWYGPKTWRPTPPPAAPGQPPAPNPKDFGVWLRNASQVPIRDMIVRVIGSDGNAVYTQSIGTVPPSEEPVFAPAPQQMRSFLWAQHWSCAAEILFVDAGNQPWTRESSGRLRPGLHGAHPSRLLADSDDDMAP
jgi:hypothetical protein